MAAKNKLKMRGISLGLILGRSMLAGALAWVVTTPAMARSESARFDIAAQPLTTALKTFATQAQMQLLYEHDAVAGVVGHAVKGELVKQMALKQLLNDTGLEIIYSSDHAATIRPSQGSQVVKHDRTETDRPESLYLAEAKQQPLSHDYFTSTEKRILEEVIVTARRREEDVQTVPVAITVISQQTLRDNNVQTIQDLQTLVPSLSAYGGQNRDTLNVAIRGQGTAATAGNTSVPLPGVVTYINDVPVPTNLNGVIAVGPGLFFDLDNVQVLKGPQGTLFGRNSTGGALLLQTARPTNSFNGRVQVGYGNYNNKEVDGAINIPVVDSTLLTRIAFTGGKRDGFTHLLGEPRHPNGIDTDNREYMGIRGTIAFKPSEGFQNDLVVSYSNYDSNGSPSIVADVNATGPIPSLFPIFTTLVAEQQALGIRTAIPVSTNLEARGSNLSVNNITRVSLNESLTFRNIVGYDDMHGLLESDFDGTMLPLVDSPGGYAPFDMHVRQFTEEAQLLGNSFGNSLDWIIGAFYLDGPPPNGYLSQTSVIFFQRNDRDWRPSEKSKALFAQGTYDLSAMIAGLKFTAGARYTWDDRSFSGRGGNSDSICTEPRVDCEVVTHTELKTGKLTWTVGLDYAVTPKTLLYVTSRRGYRAGGSNGVNLPSYDPEYVDDVELGIKSGWSIAGVPIRTNAALYYQKYKDIQVQVVNISVNQFQNYAANAAAARVWGGELEATAQLTKDLQLGINYDYLNFEYTEFGSGVNVAQLLATRTAGRPPRKYGVSGRYHLPLPSDVGDISLRANWSWQDSTTFAFSDNSDLSQPIPKIPSYGVLNLAFNWDAIGSTSLDASLFATNVTDKVYITQASGLTHSLGFNLYRYSEPRMYGVRLRYHFGSK